MVAVTQNEVPEFGLGDRLRKARDLRRYSAKDMADMLTLRGRKTSPSSVSAYENNETQPRGLPDLVRLWSEITDVPEYWFWGVSDLGKQSSAWVTADTDNPEFAAISQAA